MTADEAKQALKEGKKVRKVKWPDGEYIKRREILVDEKGDTVFEDFKDYTFEDWEIME